MGFQKNYFKNTLKAFGCVLLPENTDKSTCTSTNSTRFHGIPPDLQVTCMGLGVRGLELLRLRGSVSPTHYKRMRSYIVAWTVRCDRSVHALWRQGFL